MDSEIRVGDRVVLAKTFLDVASPFLTIPPVPEIVNIKWLVKNIYSCSGILFADVVCQNPEVKHKERTWSVDRLVKVGLNQS